MSLGIEDSGHCVLLGATEYRESAPPGRRDVVARTWRTRTRGEELRIVPDGCVELAYTPGEGTLVFGPEARWRSLRLAAGTRWGMRLRPAAAATLLGDARELAGGQLPLDQLGLRDVADDVPGDVWLREVLGRLPRRAPDRAVVHATVLLDRSGLDVEDVADLVGLSARQLRRRFAAAVGLPPATYRRIARMHRVTKAAAHRPPASWSRFAYEHGFSDQAHLIRECRALTGLSPTELTLTR